MAVDFWEQVTVRVWRNIKTHGFVPSSHFGHASVELRGGCVTNDRLQISFWPGKSAGLGLSGILSQKGGTNDQPAQDKRSEMNLLTSLRLEVGYCQANGISYPKEWDDFLAEMGKGALPAPRDGQKRTGHVHSEAGFTLWSQSPETKIKLPGLGTRQIVPGGPTQARLWGLPIPPIERWWTGFKARNPEYRAFSTSNNCAGIALMALEAGGAAAFLAPPKPHFYAEPRQVEDYARGLLSVIEQLETATVRLQAEIAALRAPPAPATGAIADGLWTVQEWKKQSALGPMQPRSSVIRDIDHALERYHGLKWGVNHAAKFAAFATMVRAICVHRQQKADSARSASVLALGDQAIRLLTNPGAMHG